MFACKGGHLDTVFTLLDNSANTSISNKVSLCNENTIQHYTDILQMARKEIPLPYFVFVTSHFSKIFANVSVTIQSPSSMTSKHNAATIYTHVVVL